MGKWGWWVIGLVGLLVVAGGLLALSETARRVVGIASEGGERKLREPMRAARGAPRVLLFALDGVGDTALKEALAAGRMPQLSGLLGEQRGETLYERGWAVPEVLTVLPSTTWAAWSAVFTGEPAARNGVPGNEWFDRTTGRYWAPGPVSVKGHEHTLQLYEEDDALLGRSLRVPTLFERADVRSHVALMPIFRGADLVTLPGLDTLKEAVSQFSRGIGVDEDVERRTYAAIDRESAERAVEAIGDHGIPDLQVVYFPGVDLHTHVARGPLEEKQRYLAEEIDPAIGLIWKSYVAHGAGEETWVVVTADHGHTPVKEDERHALGSDEAAGPPGVLEGAGFRVRALEIEPGGAEDHQAVVAYQGALAYLYLADRSTCPEPGDVCDWSRPPRLEEDVLPVVRAFHRADEAGEGVPQLKGTLELVFARPPRPPGTDAEPFGAWDGERLLPLGEFLKANPRPELLRLEERMAGLGAGPYGHLAGDVVLLARSGMHLPLEERFYFARLYRSWHGSPSARDSRIPLLIIKPGGSGEQVRAEVRHVFGEHPSQLQITPLVLELLGR